ncbi:hypothetical protein IJU97_00795 [bacterium]|nr:hypothetical protein [bacterium]
MNTKGHEIPRWVKRITQDLLKILFPVFSFTTTSANTELQLKEERSSFVVIQQRAGVGFCTAIQNFFENLKIKSDPPI